MNIYNYRQNQLQKFGDRHKVVIRQIDKYHVSSLFSQQKELFKILALSALDFGFMHPLSLKQSVNFNNIDWDDTNYDLIRSSESGLYLALLIVLYTFDILGALVLMLEIKFSKRRTFSETDVQEKLLTLDQAVILETTLDKPINHFTRAFARLYGSDVIECISRISQEQVIVYLKFQRTAQQIVSECNFIRVGKQGIIICSAHQENPIDLPLTRVNIKNINLPVPSYIIHDELKKIVEVDVVFKDYKITAKEKSGREFERRMFIELKDLENFPRCLRINHVYKLHWIFFSATEDFDDYSSMV